MYRMTLAALCALAACVPAQRPAGFRDLSVPISSSTAFDPARFQGQWQIVGAFGDAARCGVLDEEWRIGAAAFVVTGTRCTLSGAAGYRTAARLSGPGRVLRDGPGGAEEIWILWVDADYRVAAFGTPNGGFGGILARPGQARDDLITAAREVLDFNGYDISQLQVLR
ncbi:lipocalin family protein [Frigidibacter sp. RF13]|uniref:lipocalin family protein n=1 Tax=Frigidibacter sp. RF13 TaxID=2997340 RepID=UPI0022712CAD|nr:lipocalin family protein [Frigidibacter sp. RF13]MCY1126330.1 lipocalin family protein [Frigidibacter sp. RF13]